MIALLLVPTMLRAEEVQFGVRTGVSWSDNVFGVADDQQLGGEDDDPVSDFSGRISPSVAIRDPDGELTWSAFYQPSYEAYLDEGELDGFDHTLSANGSWRFAERWTLSLDESYAIYQNAVRFNEAAGPGGELNLVFRDQEVRTNATSASLQHALSQRDIVALTLSHDSIEYPDGGGNDRSSPSLALAYRHLLSERTTLGARLAWIRQTYDRQVADDDETDFYNLAGTLEYRFSPTFRIEAAAGPTLIDSTPASEFETFQFAVIGSSLAVDADSCNFGGVPGRAGLRSYEGCSVLSLLSQEDAQTLSELTVEVPTADAQGRPIDESDSTGNDLTYFARLALIKDWESWSGNLVYERSNSDTAEFGSSSVADTFSASLTWSPRRLWTFTISGAISLQEQASDQVVPFAFDLVNVPAPPGVTSVGELAEVQRVVASTEGDAEEYQTQSVSFTVNRQLTPHSFAFASVYWYRQEQDGVLNDGSRWNNLVLWVGLDWKFDPIRF
jgi:hypothetical protein